MVWTDTQTETDTHKQTQTQRQTKAKIEYNVELDFISQKDDISVAILADNMDVRQDMCICKDI